MTPHDGATESTHSTPPDSIDARLRRSEELVVRGTVLLDAGDLSGARQAFDAALMPLVEQPTSERADGRIPAQIDRVIGLVTLLEARQLVEAARDASGEPQLDERLLVVTFEAETTPSLAGNLERLPDVPIPRNAQVLNAIESLRASSRDVVGEGLRRGGGYLDMIREVFRAEGIPEELAFLPLVESSFKPTAVSRARARGMWQFMRGTAREYGLRQDWYIDEREDPEKATRAAARYLRVLYGMFEGDWHLTLAAYNAGPTRLRRAMRRSGSSDYWTIASTGRYLPRETRQYVPLALAAMIIGADPARYGFDVQLDPPIHYASVPVSQAVELERVARWTGTSVEEIRRLNPELRRWMTPFQMEDYAIKIPPGTEQVFAERLAAAAPDELVAPRWYTVERGDSLWQIARRLNMSRVDLAAANRLSANAHLSIGQRLLVPAAPGRPAASASIDRLAVEDRTTSEGDRLVYRVRRGDTLFAIARIFETTVASLKTLNRLRSNLIKPGDRLTIFSAPGR